MKVHKSDIVALLLVCSVAWGAEPDAATLFRQAETAYKQQNYASALTLLRTMQEKYPDNKQSVRGWEYIAQCENMLGDPMAAFEAYQNIWERHKDFAQLATITRNQMKIGNHFLKNKEYKNAITVYGKILENAPHSDVAAGAQYSLAQAYLGDEDYGAARAELAKLIRNYPSSQLVDDAMFDLGYVAYLQAKDEPYDQSATSEAIASFRSFISNFPSSPKVAEAQQHIRTLRSRKAAALFRTAEFYENVRVPKAAQITYREVIEQYPDTTYADEAQRRLAGAERRVVSDGAPSRQAAALYESTHAARARDEAGAGAAPRVSSVQVTPSSVRQNAGAQRMAAESRAAETMRHVSARRVAELKKNPAGREALRATMKEAYTEEIKRARATKTVWRGQQPRAGTSAGTHGPEPLPPPRSTTPRGVQAPAQAAAPPQPSAPLFSANDDEFDFEVRSDDVRIDIAPESDTARVAPASEPADAVAPTVQPSVASPAMVDSAPAVRRTVQAPAPEPAPVPPPATPIDGLSFDDILAGRASDDTEASEVVPASDWQPFASQTSSAPPPATSPANVDADSDFIVVDSAPLAASSTSPAAAEKSGKSVVQEPTVPAQNYEAFDAAEPAAPRTAAAPAPPRTAAPANADFIVVKDEPSSVPSTAPAEKPAPRKSVPTLLSDEIEQDDAAPVVRATDTPTATPSATSASRTRPRNAIAPAVVDEPAESAAREVAKAPRAAAVPAPPGQAAQPKAAAAPQPAAPATQEPSVSPEIERARMEEQTRAADTRRRVDTVREQVGREERTVRQMSADGRVRRAQYDAPTAAASETSYNVDALQRDYAGIYYLIKRGDAALQQGLHSEAKQNYGNALDRLLKLKETAPTWQADIVNYRIDYCRERMRSAQ